MRVLRPPTRRRSKSGCGAPVAALPNVLWINEMVKHEVVTQLY